MITEDYKRKTEDKVIAVYSKAQEIWGSIFDLPKVVYDRIGMTAGRAYPSENLIKLNPDYYLKNAEDMIETTVPHEIAHLIARMIDPINGGGHGRVWKVTMMHLGLKPERCHNYDTAPARLRSATKYIYACEKCGTEMELGSCRHKRIQAEGKRYFHKSDRGLLVYAKKHSVG